MGAGALGGQVFGGDGVAAAGDEEMSAFRAMSRFAMWVGGVAGVDVAQPLLLADIDGVLDALDRSGRRLGHVVKGVS